MISTLRRGFRLFPELYAGLAGTLGLAVLMTAGRTAVPVAIQQGIDRGLRAPGSPDTAVVAQIAAVTAGVLLLTTISGYAVLRRMFVVSETGLATVRARVFRHVHDLSMLRQQSEQRGALVSRMTADVDQLTGFLQLPGITLLTCTGQALVAIVVMAAYSWRLTLVVLVTLVPTALVIRACQRRLAGAYRDVRVHVGRLLGVVAESVVGAEVIRVFGVSTRTAARVESTVGGYRGAQQRALRTVVTGYSTGELAAGLALAAVVVVGTRIGVDGGLTIGELTAFLFLVALFTLPAQVLTEMLNEAQNAVACWGRVLDVLEVRPDTADPGPSGVDIPAGPIEVRFSGVGFAYPGGPSVLADIDLHIAAGSRVAMVGETGAGKTTLAKLVTRLVDPDRGEILLSGVPLRRIRFTSLRSRVVLVPQDGFLFDATVAENVRFGRSSSMDMAGAFAALGLDDWLTTLPNGLDTHVGERGDGVSVGERQLIALVRAYLGDPDLLVLDEATSAVDPATEARLQRAIDAATRDRTTLTIAHRMSTARAADEIVVVDRGRIVQRGHHEELVAVAGSVYARLYTAWLARAAR